MSWPTVSPAMWRPGVGLGDAVGASADDGDELDLPVDAARPTISMSSKGPARLAGNLVNVAGHVRDGHARLLGVAAVVEADGEDLARRGHRAAEVGLDERAGALR